nr:mpv17-like protein [Onthophagus taurus]
MSLMLATIRGLVIWYSNQLKVNPYKANCLTYGVMYLFVEVTQQKFLLQQCQLDYKKVIERSMMGTFAQGPIITSWFRWLDHHMPGTSMRSVMKKIFLTQILLAPITNLSFFIFLGLLEGSNNVLGDAIKKAPVAYFGGIMYWMPITIINFRYVPKFYRVVYNCVFGFFWTNVMFYIKHHSVERNKEACKKDAGCRKKQQ